MTTRRRNLLIPNLRPRLLSAAEAGAYCGITPDFFMEHIGSTVRPVCIGRRKLWDINALDAWIDRQAPNGQPDRPKSVKELLAEGEDDRAA